MYDSALVEDFPAPMDPDNSSPEIQDVSLLVSCSGPSRSSESAPEDIYSFWKNFCRPFRIALLYRTRRRQPLPLGCDEVRNLICSCVLGRTGQQIIVLLGCTDHRRLWAVSRSIHFFQKPRDRSRIAFFLQAVQFSKRTFDPLGASLFDALGQLLIFSHYSANVSDVIPTSADALESESPSVIPCRSACSTGGVRLVGLPAPDRGPPCLTLGSSFRRPAFVCFRGAATEAMQ